MISTDTEKEEQWKLARFGKFTASEIHKLLSKGKGSEMFGEGARTYIKQKAVDNYTGYEDRNVQTYAMMMGKVKEPEAYALYCKLLGFPGIKYFGGGDPVFIEYGPDAGCSPDALAYMPDDTISFGADFKCPTRDTHWDYLTEFKGKDKNQFDLRRVCEDYYAQIQFTMMCVKCELYHFVSYNEYFPFNDRMLILEIKPDKPYQANLDIRLKMAIKERNRLIEELKNR